MKVNRLGVLGALSALAAGLLTVVTVRPASAAAPQPVYAPAGTSVADPGMVRTGGKFYAFTTGGRAPVHTAGKAAGPWSTVGPALKRLPTWADTGAIWAPDVVKTSAGWVLYFSARAKNFDDQRCIGVAVASSVTGPYEPRDTPLICPGGRHGAPDKVANRPVANAGVIDPSPFKDAAGRRFILYKTQKTPSSIRMLRLNDKGTNWIGNASKELVRSSGIIENPVMVQRGSTFVLFASRYGYNNCSYATVYMKSSNKWNFAGKTQHKLMTTASTGICGPGGADITRAHTGGWRIFLHGWICGTGTSPCKDTPGPNARRALYAAVLKWDGSTPRVGKFL